MSKTYANGRLIIHAGDGLTEKSALPDVCKTPSPAGPVPIPYVNIARDGDLQEGSKTVEIAGNSVALAPSNLGTSSGDEPGTAGGGLVSAKIKGKLTWASSSLDVKVEGEGVIRFLDVTLHNGNKSNTASANDGTVDVGYGDDAKHSGPCDNCHEDISKHRVIETPDSRAFALKLARELSKQKDNGLRSNSSSGKLEGYMIGVLICKGPSHTIYAAHSGAEFDAFKTAVAALEGWIPCGAFKAGSVPVEQGLEYRQKLRNPRAGKPKDAQPQPPRWMTQNYDKLMNWNLRDTITDLRYTNPLGHELWAGHYPYEAGDPFPGNCAAPRLIQKALADGHVPATITEIWYSPPAPPNRPRSLQMTVSIRTHWMDGKLVKDQKFGHLETVPSCNTCQQHVTPMLCGADSSTCP